MLGFIAHHIFAMFHPFHSLHNGFSVHAVIGFVDCKNDHDQKQADQLNGAFMFIFTRI
jgi:hypothetical protein